MYKKYISEEKLIIRDFLSDSSGIESDAEKYYWKSLIDSEG